MEENLTKTEKKLNADMRNNYIYNYANLVVDNIVAVYKRIGNNNKWSLEKIINESKDIFELSKKEQKLVYKIINNILKNKYNLKIEDKEKFYLKKYD